LRQNTLQTSTIKLKTIKFVKLRNTLYTDVQSIATAYSLMFEQVFTLMHAKIKRKNSRQNLAKLINLLFWITIEILARANSYKKSGFHTANSIQQEYETAKALIHLVKCNVRRSVCSCQSYKCNLNLFKYLEKDEKVEKFKNWKNSLKNYQNSKKEKRKCIKLQIAWCNKKWPQKSEMQNTCRKTQERSYHYKRTPWKSICRQMIIKSC